MPSASKLPARSDTSGSLRLLLRAEIPVDTVQLARYLVGKVIVHDTANGRLSGRIIQKLRLIPLVTQLDHVFPGVGHHAMALFSLNEGTHMCMPRLWRVVPY